MRQLPQTNKLIFEEGTEDIIHYKRKTPLSIEDEFINNIRAVLDFNLSIKRPRLKWLAY